MTKLKVHAGSSLAADPTVWLWACVCGRACGRLHVCACAQFYVTRKCDYRMYRRQSLGNPSAGWMNANQEKGGNDK